MTTRVSLDWAGYRKVKDALEKIRHFRAMKYMSEVVLERPMMMVSVEDISFLHASCFFNQLDSVEAILKGGE